jgi:transposase-like protein
MCGQNMREARDGRGNLQWRCYRAVHRPSRPTIGFKVGTFFEGANLDCKKIFHLAYYWCMNLPLEYAEFQTGVTHPHVVFWFKKFRRICARYFRSHPIRLGGPGLTVEADETFLSRRHGRRGRRVRRRPKWIFAIVERGSGHSYLRIVRRRNAATLMPILLRHVRYWSTVNTDEWRSYRRLQRTRLFRHRAVNHGLNFVDPADPENHTQTIENKNGQLKDMIRRRHGVVDQILPTFLKEFNWRERFGQRNMIVYNFWSQVAALFPCEP